MSTLRLPSHLKAWQLKHAAFLMGLPTTGTKSELQSFISHRISEPISLSLTPRIVSVDMGIRNLGICVLEAPGLAESPAQSRCLNRHTIQTSPLKVLAWRKVDVLSHILSDTSRISDPTEESGSENSVKRIRKPKSPPQSATYATVFRPSVLANTALNVAQELLYKHKPSHILIERQRFRSGGAAAVQEWTLRVNMLESMIWACLETIRYQSRQGILEPNLVTFPALQEISPARVAKFWCSGPSSVTAAAEGLFNTDQNESAMPTELTSRATKRIEKKDKIAVVQSWLSKVSDTDTKKSNVALEFAHETQEVASSFLSETKRRRKQNGDATGKLDDLADCLLQGVAWVRWEENRRKIRDLLDLHGLENA